MAVPMGDDVMLSYQSTSYHDASALRAALKMRPAPEFEAWCEQRGILHEGRLTPRAGDARLLMNSSNTAGRRADELDFDAMRGATPARLDVGRAGPRYTTPAMLALRADHARAVDAVVTTIPRDWARRNGLMEVHSEALTRDDYLRYPERGRRIAAVDIARMKHLAPPRTRSSRGKLAKPTVLICVGDGLSSAAIEKNAKPLLKALERALKSRCNLMKPIFIRNARVRIEDHLGEILRPEVICMVVGERPGLATAESLSAYVIYRPTLKSIEPDRSVISNIHRGGIAIPEAARKIAALIDDAIRFQATGAALAKKKPNP
jgi:ethanolamine ammonia-lyase small subunit